MKLSKKLCEVCLQSFAPWHIRQVQNHNLCPACLKLAARQTGPVANNAGDKESKLVKIISQEGENLVREARESTRIITPGFIAVLLGRGIAYGLAFHYIRPNWVYADALRGALMADIVVWLIFGILQLPFKPIRFAIEFGVYALAGLYLADASALFDSPGLISAVTFLLVGILEIHFYAPVLSGVIMPIPDD